MHAIYCRSSSLGSLALRTFMWSAWSHCAIVTPDNTVIEAAAFHGVREIPLEVFLRLHSKFDEREIAVPDETQAIAWARRQIGKPYDWIGVIGVVLHRDWMQDDAWFCSELLEAACAAGGRARFVNDARRVTPQHSWMVA